MTSFSYKNVNYHHCIKILSRDGKFKNIWCLCIIHFTKHNMVLVQGKYLSFEFSRTSEEQQGLWTFLNHDPFYPC